MFCMCAHRAGIPLDRVLGLFPTKSLANTPLLGPLFVPPVSVQACLSYPLHGMMRVHGPGRL